MCVKMYINMFVVLKKKVPAKFDDVCNTKFLSWNTWREASELKQINKDVREKESNWRSVPKEELQREDRPIELEGVFKY